MIHWLWWARRVRVAGLIPLHYPACDQLASRSATSSRTGLRAASELVEDLRVHVVCVSQAKLHYAVQLASRSQTSSRPNTITLRPARRLASEQHSVMEYGLNQSATRFELSRNVEIAWTCLWQVGNQVCDLDSVMEFSQNRSQTSSRTRSRARSRTR